MPGSTRHHGGEEEIEETDDEDEEEEASTEFSEEEDKEADVGEEDEEGEDEEVLRGAHNEGPSRYDRIMRALGPPPANSHIYPPSPIVDYLPFSPMATASRELTPIRRGGQQTSHASSNDQYGRGPHADFDDNREARIEGSSYGDNENGAEEEDEEGGGGRRRWYPYNGKTVNLAFGDEFHRTTADRAPDD
ncbi:hypothetical protein BZA05DRAFT_422851 [Tricharina praecox]|uniref:uncharacterized protein n=1 Tax=Tricharina praecox TaxID=43433 RepID=UPI00222084F8|nr:uncharacterized protein BZA05DRAFT_422851 [Tricharina praecox]KAI5841315.1 hypothetical protein BZA05DRAFT_422851 [Tricharina praecox]